MNDKIEVTGHRKLSPLKLKHYDMDYSKIIFVFLLSVSSTKNSGMGRVNKVVTFGQFRRTDHSRTSLPCLSILPPFSGLDPISPS